MHPYEAMQLGLLAPETTPYYQIGEFTTTKLSQSWVLSVTAGSSYYVEWGDGVVDWFAGISGNQTITHTYATAGTYKPKWWIQDATKLLVFNCAANGLTGTLPSFAACTSLTTFYAYTNNFNGTVPSFATCIGLVNFGISSNAFTGEFPTFSACTSLLYLNATSNKISSYIPQTIASTCRTFNLSDNALSQFAVDAILADMATNIASRPAGGTLDLSGGTNAIPSSAGLINKATIAARPWTVTTN